MNARVVGRLHETHGLESLLLRAPEHRLHQSAADGAVLRGRVDGNRADSGDRFALPEEIAARHATVRFGDQGMDIRPRHELLHQPSGDFRSRKVRWKTVLLGNGFECVVADPPSHRGVGRGRSA